MASGGQHALVTTSIEGRVLFWSAGAEALLGYDEPEATGRHIHDLMPKKHRRLDDLGVEEVLAGRTVRNMIVKTIHRDGGILRCLQTMVPLRDPLGKVVGVLRIMMDLTHFHQAKKALVAAQAQMEEVGRTAAIRQRPPRGGADAAYIRERSRLLREYLHVIHSDLERMNQCLSSLGQDCAEQIDRLEQLRPAELQA